MKTISAVILEDSSRSEKNIETELLRGGITNITQMSYPVFMKKHNSVPSNLVVLARDSIDISEANRLTSLANMIKQKNFLILVQQTSILACQALAAAKNVVALQISSEVPVFQQVIKKLFKLPNETPEMIQSRSIRFQTDETVRMVAMETGLLIQTRMKNYSGTGAFLEYRGISLKVGSKLKINFTEQESPSPAKGLHLNGKVVWVQDKGTPNANFKVGEQGRGGRRQTMHFVPVSSPVQGRRVITLCLRWPR